jgi:hypothetical protein
MDGGKILAGNSLLFCTVSGHSDDNISCPLGFFGAQVALRALETNIFFFGLNKNKPKLHLFWFCFCFETNQNKKSVFQNKPELMNNTLLCNGHVQRHGHNHGHGWKWTFFFCFGLFQMVFGCFGYIKTPKQPVSI